MGDEVPNEVQAAMSLKLMDSVKTLVRQHLKDALEDPDFMASVNSYPLAQSVSRNLNANEYAFQNAVKTVITQQMNKF